MALERWDRLREQEQIRFRALGVAALGNAALHLSPAERKELRVLWKRLKPRRLLGEIMRRAARTSVSSPRSA